MEIARPDIAADRRGHDYGVTLRAASSRDGEGRATTGGRSLATEHCRVVLRSAKLSVEGACCPRRLRINTMNYD